MMTFLCLLAVLAVGLLTVCVVFDETLHHIGSYNCSRNWISVSLLGEWSRCPHVSKMLNFAQSLLRRLLAAAF